MVEEEEVSAVVLICQVLIHPGVDDGGRGAVWHWWDYVAVNVRLRKEEEEVLRCEGDGNDGNGYRGRGWRGGGKKGMRFVEQSLSW
jgi:hypothetical protein